MTNFKLNYLGQVKKTSNKMKGFTERFRYYQRQFYVPSNTTITKLWIRHFLNKRANLSFVLTKGKATDEGNYYFPGLNENLFILPKTESDRYSAESGANDARIKISLL